MNPIAILKVSIDILMTLAVLFLMGYQIWGDAAHEWAGAVMLILFIVHHILNRNWYKNLFKGRFSHMRIFQICVDMLLLAAMLIQMYSGIVMSRHVFAFLTIDRGMALARRLHILGAYWGFTLMSVHLGMHWNMFLGILRKKAGIRKESKIRKIVCFAAGFLVAAYGSCVLVKRDFITYLLLKTEFVFLDYSELPILFYIDYIAVMGLFVFLAHYIRKLFRKPQRRK